MLVTSPKKNLRLKRLKLIRLIIVQTTSSLTNPLLLKFQKCRPLIRSGWSFATLPLHLRAAGESVLGVVQSGRPDWRQGHEDSQLAQRRQEALDTYNRNRTLDHYNLLQVARRDSRRFARSLQQDWWQSRLQVMQRAKDPAGLYSEARALGRLLKTHGLSRKPLTDHPLAKPAQLLRRIFNRCSMWSGPAHLHCCNTFLLLPLVYRLSIGMLPRGLNF